MYLIQPKAKMLDLLLSKIEFPLGLLMPLLLTSIGFGTLLAPPILLLLL